MEETTSAALLFAGALDVTPLDGGSDAGLASATNRTLLPVRQALHLLESAETSGSTGAHHADPLIGGFGDKRLFNPASGQSKNDTAFLRRGTAALILHSPSVMGNPQLDAAVDRRIQVRRRQLRAESTKKGKLLHELLENQHRRGASLLSIENQSMGIIDHAYDAALPRLTKRWEAQYSRQQTTSVKMQKRAGEWAVAHRNWRTNVLSPSRSPARSPAGRFSLTSLRRGGSKVMPSPSPKSFHAAAQRRHSGINISTHIIDQIEAAEEEQHHRMGWCLEGLEKALDMHWLIDASGRVLELSDSLKRRVKADMDARAMEKKTARVPGWQIAALSRHKRKLVRKRSMSAAFESHALTPATHRVIKTKLNSRIVSMRKAAGQFARDEP